MANPIIYGIPQSPYVRAVRTAFDEKGASYDMPPFNPMQMKDEPHLQRHPFGKMPVLDHDGLVIYETPAILRYIDDLYPQPSLQPTDLRERTRMNQLIAINQCYLFPAVAGIVFCRLVAPAFGFPTDEARVAASIEPTREALKAVQGLIASDGYLTGETFSLADILLAPHFAMLAATPEGPDLLAEVPRLSACLKRIDERPSYQRTAASL